MHPQIPYKIDSFHSLPALKFFKRPQKERSKQGRTQDEENLRSRHTHRKDHQHYMCIERL